MPDAVVEYTISVPQPAHRYVRVSILFPAQPGRVLDIHMSRSSPGRYALHEFAKNVFGEEALDAQGSRLPLERTGIDRWTVTARDSAVRFTYNVYGDTLNGTHLAVDESHAHMNAPATLAWTRGLEDAAARVRLVQPEGRAWTVATQLFPTADPLVFTAPNLAYLMDSPIEFGDVRLHSFTVGVRPDGPDTTVRVALHEIEATDDAEEFLENVERIIAEQRAVFGELPAFEPGFYTFLADYLPWAQSDAMEHRNSAVLTSSAPASFARIARLDTIAHEFFHVWNVERIRPRSLEPFDLTGPSASHELWLAEGFTNYYAPLTLRRAGFTSTEQWLAWMAAVINQVTQAPARGLRSPSEVSVMAPLVDGAQHGDRTILSSTFLSYYTWGSAVALGLDLSLRARTNGAKTLDDYLRELWHRHGRPGGRAPGVVDNPYTSADLVDALGAVAGDVDFARSFFARFINGLEVPDYAALLAPAGFSLRAARPGQSWVGEIDLLTSGPEVRVGEPPGMGTPAYEAGLAQDDVIQQAGQMQIDSTGAWSRAVAGVRPGSVLSVRVMRRGQPLTLSVRVGEHPDIEIVRVERTGVRLTSQQEAFRRAWLESRATEPSNR
ncbi:MAG: M61 family metallopeptidase [Vicinamibacterales bacterium]